MQDSCEWISRIGNHRRGLEMAIEVVEDATRAAGRTVAASHALLAEEVVFALERAGQIGFGAVFRRLRALDRTTHQHNFRLPENGNQAVVPDT